MLVARLGFFILRHKSGAESARIWFPLRQHNQDLGKCFMANALLVSGAEAPEDAGGGCFSTEPGCFPSLFVSAAGFIWL